MSLSYHFGQLLLIIMRLSGCILLNPIFGKKNIPAIFKIGLTLFISYFVYSAIPLQDIAVGSTVELIVSLMKEFVLGYIFGYIIQLFISVMIMAGEMIDSQMGISMAKIYDPQSNTSVAVSASLLNVMFMLIFFSMNAHLTLIQVFCFSFKVIPLGKAVFNADFFLQLTDMFGYMLIYAMKLSIPILAAELITEIGVGIIMKAVPQIDIFTVNLQLKIILGFTVMLILVPPFASFLERLVLLMFDKIILFFNWPVDGALLIERRNL
jgi:flagellar biosynthetic protein FliR